MLPQSFLLPSTAPSLPPSTSFCLPTWDDVGHAAQYDNTQRRAHVLNEFHPFGGRREETMDGSRKEGGGQ